jgi:hypothetical protein
MLDRYSNIAAHLFGLHTYVLRMWWLSCNVVGIKAFIPPPYPQHPLPIVRAGSFC